MKSSLSPRKDQVWTKAKELYVGLSTRGCWPLSFTHPESKPFLMLRACPPHFSPVPEAGDGEHLESLWQVVDGSN